MPDTLPSAPFPRWSGYEAGISSCATPQRGCPFWLKRLLDYLVAVSGLVLFSPLWLATAVFIAISAGRPVFFLQRRPGRFGKPFVLFKFKTMSQVRDAAGNLLPDADRLTRWGRTLRSLSLDEPPQLWNVLRGEMSLVGPRPLLMEYLERYTPEQARRHSVLPGITGWAQINGRNALSWEEKFRFDVWYVDHWSLALDLKILWLTLLRVVRREGISHDGEATMPPFAPLEDRRPQAPMRCALPDRNSQCKQEH